MTMTCDFLEKLFDRCRKLHYICIHKQQAKVAQLVERNLAKVEVASSNLVFRSKEKPFLLHIVRVFCLKFQRKSRSCSISLFTVCFSVLDLVSLMACS